MELVKNEKSKKENEEQELNATQRKTETARKKRM